MFLFNLTLWKYFEGGSWRVGGGRNGEGEGEREICANMHIQIEFSAKFYWKVHYLFWILIWLKTLWGSINCWLKVDNRILGSFFVKQCSISIVVLLIRLFLVIWLQYSHRKQLIKKLSEILESNYGNIAIVINCYHACAFFTHCYPSGLRFTELYYQSVLFK